MDETQSRRFRSVNGCEVTAAEQEIQERERLRGHGRRADDSGA